MADIIYIAKAENGLCKIGLTSGNLEKRIRILNCQSPVGIHLIYATEVSQADKRERGIHIYLANYRARGEWFDIPDTKLDDVKRLIGGRELRLEEVEKYITKEVIGNYTIYYVNHKAHPRMNCPRCLYRQTVRLIGELYKFKCATCSYEMEFAKGQRVAFPTG